MVIIQLGQHISCWHRLRGIKNQLFQQIEEIASYGKAYGVVRKPHDSTSVEIIFIIYVIFIVFIFSIGLVFEIVRIWVLVFEIV